MYTCSFPSVYVCFEIMSLQLWYEWDVTILDFHKEPKHKNDFLMIQFESVLTWYESHSCGLLTAC